MAGRKKTLNTVCWIIGFFVLWEAVADIMLYLLHDPNAEKKLTAPSLILQQFVADAPHLLTEAGITFSRAAIGFAIGAAFAFLLAVLMSLSRLIETTLLPYLLLSQMIPILGLAPIIFSLVKDLDTARIVIAAYMSFFPISINLLSGFKAVRTDQQTLMYSYACSKWQLYRFLILPSALPYLFAGMKIAAPLAVTASILVDTLSVQDGIGQIIVYSLAGGGALGAFWPAVVLGALLGVISYNIVTLAEFILVPWDRGEAGKEKSA
ncbi:ABC transporter permease [Agathobaculum sp. Marseille-P7918]|uniref:ABC transporter permease n=1 Tax=Agathobaculum sp. Marseille-P7918 TaxID=2479843 RepID=UPI000F62F022|nr:ABC transporter permease subunit [Agathobaculum sp. Marseille-P7918]